MRREFGGLVLTNTTPAHVGGLAELQRIVFPTLAPEERFEERHYLKHLELFPDGQFCVLDGERVVGMTSTIRLSFDFAHPNHSFAEIIQGGYLTSHEPDGPWLYGADVGTHPDYRRRGIARALYAARQELVHRLDLLGQLTVGMPSGYGAVASEISAEDYLAEVATGRRTDPTISAQVRVGFEIRDLIPNYIRDPVCGGYGVVLVLPSARQLTFPA